MSVEKHGGSRWVYVSIGHNGPPLTGAWVQKMSETIQWGVRHFGQVCTSCWTRHCFKYHWIELACETLGVWYEMQSLNWLALDCSINIQWGEEHFGLWTAGWTQFCFEFHWIGCLTCETLGVWHETQSLKWPVLDCSPDPWEHNQKLNNLIMKKYVTKKCCLGIGTKWHLRALAQL